MNRSPRRHGALAALLLLGSASSGRAQPADAQAEARQRFDHGLRLFNESDNAGALAEFKRVYELSPNPVVLNNIALTYAAMNRPVEALDRLLQNPGSLAPERVERARAARAAQAERIAELDVEVNVPGAVIDIDTIEAARAPLAGPLRVVGGTHVVGAIAPGYSPSRKEITLAGRSRGKVSFELVALQGRLAHLQLHTHLPGARVVVDGQPLGTTPLPASLTLTPGPHQVALERPGYVASKQDIVLGDGATGGVSLDPEEDPSVLGVEGRSLRLDLREPEAVVTVDGKPRGVYLGALRVMPGVHHLRIERGGFEPQERDVTVSPSGTTTVRIELDPTPETRAALAAQVRSHRTWGIVGIAAGALMAGGGAALLAVNTGAKSTAQSQYSATLPTNQPTNPLCDVSAAGSNAVACTAAQKSAFDNLQSVKNRDIVGYVGLGVGGAALVTGLVILLTGDDPHRYDHGALDETVGWRLAPLLGGPSSGLALTGTF